MPRFELASDAYRIVDVAALDVALGGKARALQELTAYVAAATAVPPSVETF